MDMIVFIACIDVIIVPAVSGIIYYYCFFSPSPEIQIWISIKVRTLIYPE